MLVKNFVLAAQEADREEDVPIEFAVNDGDTFLAYPPTEGQMALFSMAMASTAEEADQLAAVMELFKNMLDIVDYRRLRAMLGDRNSGFTLRPLMEILDYLVGEFAARPTQPSSVSTSLRKPAGTRSTASSPAKGSTRSTSRRVGSAT